MKLKLIKFIVEKLCLIISNNGHVLHQVWKNCAENKNSSVTKTNAFVKLCCLWQEKINFHWKKRTPQF